MVQKKAPLTFKDFMASSLIIHYPCNRSSARTAPKMIGKEEFLELCKRCVTKTKVTQMSSQKSMID